MSVRLSPRTHHGDLAALDGDDADARAVLDVVALHWHRQRQLRRVRQRLRERVRVELLAHVIQMQFREVGLG